MESQDSLTIDRDSFSDETWKIQVFYSCFKFSEDNTIHCDFGQTMTVVTYTQNIGNYFDDGHTVIISLNIECTLP